MKYITHRSLSVRLLSCLAFVFFIHPCGITSGTAGSPSAPPGPGSSGFPGFEMSEKEYESLYSALQNMSDEDLQEIEELSKKMLSDMGYDPVTLQPKAKEPVSVPQKPTPALKPAPPPITIQPEPSKYLLQSVPFLISSLIDRLTQIRTKTTTSQTVDRKLKQWLPDLNELIYDLKVIDKTHHHKRLAAPEFDKLRTTLSHLDAQLAAAMPLLAVTGPEQELWESPYEMLNIEPTATQSQIEQAYQSLKEQIGPNAVSERLTKEGVEKADVQRAVKEAELSFEFITDAYEKIKEPKSRAVIDSEIKASNQKKEASESSFKAAIDKVTAAFSNAVYQDQLLNNIETFLKQYEPTEKEMRKHMEEAEAARLEEQKKFLERPLARETRALHVKSTEGQYGYGGGLRGYDYQGAKAGYAPSYYGGPSYPSMPNPSAHKEGRGEGGGGKAGKGGATDGGGSGAAGSKKEAPKAAQQPLSFKQVKEQQPKAQYPESGTKPMTKEEIDPFVLKLSDLDQKVFKFNRNFEPDYFKKIAEGNVKKEDLEKSLMEFADVSQINNIADDLDYISYRVKKATDRKKNQYKTILSGVKDNLKKFKDHTTFAHDSLKEYAKEDGQMTVDITKTLQSTLKHVNDINDAFEHKSKTPIDSLKSMLKT